MPVLMKPEEKLDLALLELSAVETAIPAYTLYLLTKSVHSAGYVFRGDIAARLNQGSAAPIVALNKHGIDISRVAKRLDDTALRVLRGVSYSTEVHLMYAVALFILKLIDLQLFADRGNMGVVVALLLMDDLKIEGGVDRYTYNEALLETTSNRLLHLFQQEGLYKLQLTVPKPEKLD